MNNDDEGARLTRLEENRELIAKHRAEVSRSPAPSERAPFFAESVARAERGESLMVDVQRMARCIREQQSALSRLLNDVEPHATCAWAEGTSVTEARATLVRWRIEP